VVIRVGDDARGHDVALVEPDPVVTILRTPDGSIPGRCPHLWPLGRQRCFLRGSRFASVSVKTPIPSFSRTRLRADEARLCPIEDVGYIGTINDERRWQMGISRDGVVVIRGRGRDSYSQHRWKGDGRRILDTEATETI
jgi:hypothetical protein